MNAPRQLASPEPLAAPAPAAKAAPAPAPRADRTVPLRTEIGAPSPPPAAAAPVAMPGPAPGTAPRPVNRPPDLATGGAWLALTSVTSIQRTAGHRAVARTAHPDEDRAREAGARPAPVVAPAQGPPRAPGASKASLAPSPSQNAAPSPAGAAAAASAAKNAPAKAGAGTGGAPAHAGPASSAGTPAPSPPASADTAKAAARPMGGAGAGKPDPGVAPPPGAPLTARAPAPAGGAGTRGGGAAGGSGGGGAADPALQAYQSKVSGAVAKVKPRPLTGGQGAKVGATAKQKVDERQKAKSGLPGEAKQAVPKPKQPEALPPFPDDETKQAVARIDGKLGRVHTARTLPPLETTPRGHVPVVGAAPAAPAAADPAAAKGPDGAGAKDKKGTAAGKDAKDPKDDKDKKDAKDAPAPARPTKVADPATVTAEAPKTQEDAEKAAPKADVGAVVAQLLAEPGKHAQRVVDDAVSVAYNGQLATIWKECAQPSVKDETEFVDQELRRVATAVGIGSEQLDQRIAQARQALAAQGDEIKADVDTTLAKARQDVAAGNAAFDQAITDARHKADDDVKARADAAAGRVDTAKVKADRDRLVGVVDAKTGEGVVSYDAAATKMKAAIDATVQGQRRAYQDAAAEDETQAKAEHPTDAVAARTANRPTKYWLDERLTALGAFLAGAKRGIEDERTSFDDDLRAAGHQAREDIRDWAARRLGHERGFWERLMDMVHDWMAQSRIETAAWEKRRAADAAIHVDTDIAFLQDEATKLSKMSKEQQQKELSSLSEDQIAVVSAFFGSKGNVPDLLGALAAGMITRLSMQQRPGLLKAFDARVMALGEGERERVYLLAAAESPGLSPPQRADRLHDAFKGPGTDEAGVFAALAGLTALGGKAVEFAYQERWEESLRTRLDEELNDWLTWSSHDIDRATTLLNGNGADAIAVQLDQAMHGNWNGLDLGGTDEDTIFAALRNKSPEEVDAIKKAYKARYGRDLQAEVKGELHEWFVAGTHDEDRADALFKSDTQLADSISMDQAMHGGWLGLGIGTDRKTLESTYEQNDKELEAEADTKGWDSAELARRKTQRRASIDRKYQGKYGQTLTAAFEDDMSDADLALVQGLREQDGNKVDAARIALEHDSVFYSDDKVINAALQGGFKRAFADRKRDANLLVDEEMAAQWADMMKLPAGQARDAARRQYYQDWSPEEQRKKRHQATADARTQATQDAKDNFPKLEATYDAAYKGKSAVWSTNGQYGGLRADVAMDTSMVQGEKSKALIAGQGTLTESQEVTFAVKGVGTDDDIVRDVFKGKDKKEMDRLASDWEKDNPGQGSFKDWVLDDFSGRDKQEMEEQIDYGEAETPRQKAERAGRLLTFEKSSWLDWGSSREVAVMESSYAQLLKAADAHDAQAKAMETDKAGFDWEKHATLAGQADASAAVFDSSVTSHRKSADVVSDTVTQVIGAVVTAVVVIAAIAADIITAGGAVAATPAWAAFLGSMWGAITVGAVGLALTMGTKQLLKGGAYGWEDIATDLAVGAVDIATAAFTAGMGGKLLKGSKGLSSLFAQGRLGRAAAKFIVQGAEGMVQAAPGALLGQVVNPANYRKGENAILNILGGAAAQVGVAGLMAGGMGALHGAIQTDLVRMRLDTGYQAEMFEKFKARNPGATREEFVAKIDGLIGSHTELGFDDPRMQESMRVKLMEHIPPGERIAFKDVSIEVMKPQDFDAAFASSSGRAVTVIRNGEPVVVLKGGSALGELAFEGPHLQQIRDPENAPRVAKLSEERMGRWSELGVEAQVDAYREKVAFEIEAHEKILRSLDAQKAAGEDGPGWAEAREKTEANLEGLRGLQAKVEALTPERRLAIGEGRETRPEFLDQPARLFSKDPKRPAGMTSGPQAAPAVDEKRARVAALREDIATLEGQAKSPKGLTEGETKQLAKSRAELDRMYDPNSHGSLPEAEAALFDPKPGESLADYGRRLEAMRGELELNALKEGRLELIDAHDRIVKRVAADEARVKVLQADEAAIIREYNANYEAQKQNRAKPVSNERFFEGQRLAAEAEAMNTRLRTVRAEQAELTTRRGSLAYGDQPWRTVSIADVTDPKAKSVIGLAGELDTAATVGKGGFEPLGRTLDPRTVQTRESFQKALQNRQGIQDIDGIFQRERQGTREYLVGDSKATLDTSPSVPTGPGELKTMTTGQGERQLSNEWLDRHLDKMGLSGRDLANIRAGLKDPGKPVTVTHADGTIDTVVVQKIYAQTWRDNAGVTHTRLFTVNDVSPIEVKIGPSFRP